MREHSSAAQRYAAALARRMGMGTSELAALEHLEAAGTMTPGQLGGRLSMSPGAVTALVDRLEGRGTSSGCRTPKTAGARSCARPRRG
jgi:DNA-binding MarR family transcriptional regulator